MCATGFPFNVINTASMPTFLNVGDSGCAKTTTIGNLVFIEFRNGTSLLSGPGMTTPCQVLTIIDPNVKEAEIFIVKKSKEELEIELKASLFPSLVKEVKNAIASMPTSGAETIKQFAEKAASTRFKLENETFRLEKLLLDGSSRDEYEKNLSVIFESLCSRVPGSFRTNYINTSKNSKSEALHMINMLIENTLQDSECITAFSNMVNVIIQEINKCLDLAGFSTQGYATSLNPEAFTVCCKAISNSMARHLQNVQSAACGIKDIKMRVPGKGIVTKEDTNAVYCMIDVVGFTNDGIENVNSRIIQATLTPHHYDGINYYASNKPVNKVHASYLSGIFNSIRPTCLNVICTYRDLDEIFTTDEYYPTSEQIHEADRIRQNEMYDILTSISTNDIPVILPLPSQILCISNKVSMKKNGEAACAIYNESQYDSIRAALARSYNLTRNKIHIDGVIKTIPCLHTQISHLQAIGQIINQLSSAIDQEYGIIRDESHKIHHWTFDAILYNLAQGKEHYSNTTVWRNVYIKTYTELAKICFTSCGDLKFNSGINLTAKKDFDIIRAEFTANWKTELHHVVREYILVEQESGQDSIYKTNILNLARTSKTNKWKIAENLRMELMNAVTQPDYLLALLEKSFTDAWEKTYERILF